MMRITIHESKVIFFRLFFVFCFAVFLFGILPVGSNDEHHYILRLSDVKGNFFCKTAWKFNRSPLKKKRRDVFPFGEGELFGGTVLNFRRL